MDRPPRTAANLGIMKIAAFDLDGTILFADGVATETTEAIRAWREAGHLAVAATGKSMWAMRYALDDTDITFDYSVVFTGAAVADRESRLLYSSTLDTRVVKHITRELAGLDGVAVYGTALNERDVRFSSRVPLSAKNTVLHDFAELAPDRIDQREFVGVPIWVPDNPALKRQLQDWLVDTFEVGCVINQNFLDVVPVGTTKAAGLSWLAGHMGLKRSEVQLYTFGDSWNDLPMHEIADHSFSFPWSPREVHAATDEIIGSVAEALPGLLDRAG